MRLGTKAHGIRKDRYLELVREFPLRPLRKPIDYRRATTMLDRFATAPEGSLPAAEQDYMDILMLLIEDYDRRYVKLDMSQVGPIDVLKHLMNEHGMNTVGLGELLGSKGTASEVLNGKRALSKSNMMKLAARFNVDVSVFFPSLSPK
jgi:HTH-type transcriptional regulator/antitoxin HigA